MGRIRDIVADYETIVRSTESEITHFGGVLSPDASTVSDPDPIEKELEEFVGPEEYEKLDGFNLVEVEDELTSEKIEQMWKTLIWNADGGAKSYLEKRKEDFETSLGDFSEIINKEVFPREDELFKGVQKLDDASHPDYETLARQVSSISEKDVLITEAMLETLNYITWYSDSKKRAKTLVPRLQWIVSRIREEVVNPLKELQGKISLEVIQIESTERASTRAATEGTVVEPPPVPGTEVEPPTSPPVGPPPPPESSPIERKLEVKEPADKKARETAREQGGIDFAGGTYTGKAVERAGEQIPSKGQGKLEFPDGSYFEGVWKDGVLEGEGKHNSVNPPFTAEGIFVEGMLSEGKVEDSNGTREGKWKEGVLHGQGKQKFPGATEFEGNFVDGKFINGKKIFPDGSILEGEYRDDIIVLARATDFMVDSDTKLTGLVRYITGKGVVLDGKGIKEVSGELPQEGKWKEGELIAKRIGELGSYDSEAKVFHAFDREEIGVGIEDCEGPELNFVSNPDTEEFEIKYTLIMPSDTPDGAPAIEYIMHGEYNKETGEFASQANDGRHVYERNTDFNEALKEFVTRVKLESIDGPPPSSVEGHYPESVEPEKEKIGVKLDRARAELKKKLGTKKAKKWGGRLKKVLWAAGIAAVVIWGASFEKKFDHEGKEKQKTGHEYHPEDVDVGEDEDPYLFVDRGGIEGTGMEVDGGIEDLEKLGKVKAKMKAEAEAKVKAEAEKEEKKKIEKKKKKTKSPRKKRKKKEEKKKGGTQSVDDQEFNQPEIDTSEIEPHETPMSLEDRWEKVKHHHLPEEPKEESDGYGEGIDRVENLIDDSEWSKADKQEAENYASFLRHGKKLLTTPGELESLVRGSAKSKKVNAPQLEWARKWFKETRKDLLERQVGALRNFSSGLEEHRKDEKGWAKVRSSLDKFDAGILGVQFVPSGRSTLSPEKQYIEFKIGLQINLEKSFQDAAIRHFSKKEKEEAEKDQSNAGGAAKVE